MKGDRANVCLMFVTLFHRGSVGCSRRNLQIMQRKLQMGHIERLPETQ